MILYYNEKSDSAGITVNSQIVNYPVSNVIDSRLSRVFKTSATTTAEIVFDLGSALSVDSVCIANHNFTSSATVKIQGNASDVWTSPSIDETLTYNSKIINKVIASASYRYWRIQVVDATNPDGAISIGRIWIGESYETPGIAPAVSVSYNSTSNKSRSISGQSYLDINYKYHNFSVSHPVITHDEKSEFEEILDDVDIGIPFFVEFDEECVDLTVYYVTLDATVFDFSILGNTDYYTVSYGFIEEI